MVNSLSRLWIIISPKITPIQMLLLKTGIPVIVKSICVYPLLILINKIELHVMEKSNYLRLYHLYMDLVSLIKNSITSSYCGICNFI